MIYDRYIVELKYDVRDLREIIYRWSVRIDKLEDALVTANDRIASLEERLDAQEALAEFRASGEAAIPWDELKTRLPKP